MKRLVCILVCLALSCSCVVVHAQQQNGGSTLTPLQKERVKQLQEYQQWEADKQAAYERYKLDASVAKDLMGAIEDKASLQAFYNADVPKPATIKVNYAKWSGDVPAEARKNRTVGIDKNVGKVEDKEFLLITVPSQYHTYEDPRLAFENR